LVTVVLLDAGVVAVVELVLLVDVGVVVVVVVVVLVLVLLADVELEAAVALVLELWQSLAARSPTVAAPWARFCSRVVLTVVGRFSTSLLKARAALVAGPHWPDWTAVEIDASWSFRLLAWSPVSRPLLPPQATTNETAKPRPPARNAREP
jgi:hypothetical protein